MEEEEGGMDSDGNAYASRNAMWAQEAREENRDGRIRDCQTKQQWYEKGVRYWEGVEASVNGVLGGYGQVNARDVKDSDLFLMEVLRELLPEALSQGRRLVALDCGAGVGRVAKNLLLRRFHEVDLVEPVAHFLNAAREVLELPCNGGDSSGVHRAVNFYCTSLQDLTLEVNRYDVIWVQWCIGHLTDQDFVAFFKRAKAGLKSGGFFVLKENIAMNGFVVDKQDSSVTRSDAYFRGLFKKAGLFLYKTKPQKGFPRELFSVQMYVLTIGPSKSTPPIAHGTRARRNEPGIIR